MDENQSDNESLIARIQQLEQERGELHKDIEQLCMQQAGPSYIGLATQMHFRRIAGLEQEIENLKKKLAVSSKENRILQEELSEAKRIKTHLDQLHTEEVKKNTEVGKQLQYFRGAIANAFSDRDNAVLEAERAKENEELMSQKLNEAEKRLKEHTTGSIDTQGELSNLQMKLEKQQQEIEIYKNIIDKFYKIRQKAYGGNGSTDSSEADEDEEFCWNDKCACLYNDPSNMWSFDIHQNAVSTDHLAALKKELEAVKSDFQNETQMAWEIQKHMQREKKVLERKIKALREKKVISDRLITDGISSLREYHTKEKTDIVNLLEEGRTHLQSIVESIQEEMKRSKDLGSAVAAKAISSRMPKTTQSIDSEALTRALQEKVSALLLLSQQEERHLLEENVHDAVQKTMDELQRNLHQVTEEKVKALMELAFLKQEYQLLLERTIGVSRQGNILAKTGEKRIINNGRDGKLKSLWKRTTLNAWLGTEENLSTTAHPHRNPEESFPNRRRSCSMEDARLQIENATMKESMHSLVRLTSNIHKLRVSLMQVKRSPASQGISTVLDEVIREAELVRIALGSALPLSWSGEGDLPFSSDDENHNSDSGKIDSVTAAGLEMIELLTFAAQMMQLKTT